MAVGMSVFIVGILLIAVGVKLTTSTIPLGRVDRSEAESDSEPEPEPYEPPQCAADCFNPECIAQCPLVGGYLPFDPECYYNCDPDIRGCVVGCIEAEGLPSLPPELKNLPALDNIPDLDRLPNLEKCECSTMEPWSPGACMFKRLLCIGKAVSEAGKGISGAKE